MDVTYLTGDTTLASVHLLRRTWRKPVRAPQAEAVAGA